MTGRSDRISPITPSGGPWLLLATLGVLVAITIPEIGAGPWPFTPAAVHPRGLLGPLVRVADRKWDLGILRSTAVLATVTAAIDT